MSAYLLRRFVQTECGPSSEVRQVGIERPREELAGALVLVGVAASVDPAGSGRERGAVNAAKGPFEVLRPSVGILGGESVADQLLRLNQQPGVDREELAQQLVGVPGDRGLTCNPGPTRAVGELGRC